MEEPIIHWSEALPRLLALAARLEGEGQYNNAKLLRAAASSLAIRAALQVELPEGAGFLPAEIEGMAGVLAELGYDETLLGAMRRGSDAMAEGRLPLIHETPDAYVCRGCGHLVLGDPGYRCPDCGAWQVSFQRFPAVFWLDALTPPRASSYLRQTPMDVEMLLEGLSEAEMNRPAPDGGWAIRNLLIHLRDAQGVLHQRLEMLLEQDYPTLESLAVFSWASREGSQPPSARHIFTEYRSSRQATLTRLEGLPLELWSCRGFHKEFGEVTLLQQASYFAVHEITHLPAIQALRARS